MGTIHVKSINQGSPVKPICFISRPLSHLKDFPVDYGVMLESMYDLQKHIHKWCPCNEDTDNEDEPPTKKQRMMDEEDEDDVFYILMNKAKEKNDEQKDDDSDDDDDSEHDDDDPEIRAKVLREVKEKLRGRAY